MPVESNCERTDQRRAGPLAAGLTAALMLVACAGPAGASDDGLRARLSAANPEAGAEAFEVCGSCHSVERDGEPLIGPGLWGIVGRPVASEAGFDYSDALLAFGGTWTLERLEKLIENPNAVVPGNTMGFYGVRDARERADILAYLLTLHDDDEVGGEPPEGEGETPTAAE
ncbi:MAG: c-type cytochrome [Steroidobacteraceae bacterium]|jgi:cytochrome c|nr:c-type cytochrome [Steroidobacteraceae bacterium]